MKVSYCRTGYLDWWTSKIIFWLGLSSSSFKNWIYQENGSTNTSCSPNLKWSNRIFFKMMKLLCDLEYWLCKSKCGDFWPSLHKSQQVLSKKCTIAGSIFWVKVYIWLAVCSKSEVMLKDSTTLSVNVPWALLTPFLRIGARHRAFFSSLDLWRLVQETILYFQLAMSCIFQITKSVDFESCYHRNFML